MKNTRINTASLVTVSAALALLSGSIFAASPTSLTDNDGDGVISAEEIRLARDTSRADLLTQFDTDGNGELSRDEKRAAREARYAEQVALRMGADSQ